MCSFMRHAESLQKQGSIVDNSPWNLEDDLSDMPGDALTLAHLNAAIQLLTAPSNDEILGALTALVGKHGDCWPGIFNLLRKLQSGAPTDFPHYDYLADLQDSLLEMDETSACEVLVLLGEELMEGSFNGIIERAFRCLGADLQEFLGSLDGVYDVLKLQEEDITDTGFVCAGEGELIFTSERPVIAWLLQGSLKYLTRLLYSPHIEVHMEPVDGDIKKYRYMFITTDDTVPEKRLQEKSKAVQRPVPSDGVDLKINATSFCRAFPWHFIMDENLDLVQLGKGFSRLFKSSFLVNSRQATTYFRFKRPLGLALQFREIARRTNTPFLISIRAPPGKPDFFAKGLEIKGQMVFCPESNSLLFIGSPFLDGLEGLTCNGLFISDIPLHDATREVILVGEQARAQDGLRRRMDKLKSSIEEGNTAVAKERKKNVSLLQLIFPAEIAERLWLGSEIDAKTHPDVTILFSDIVGFTSICSRAKPIMVINMLESLYKDFDEYCGIFDVYKVETIGDAYCVASGLHRMNPAPFYDAHKVAWMALQMIDSCNKHITHDGEHIKMRIGIHTGTVLAGVVGRKMPRYCLFGHNVTIANKFESSSEACKVNISSTTKEWLTKHEGFNFKLEPRSRSCVPKEVVNTDESSICYFLEGYTHPTVSDCEPLAKHVEAAMAQIQ